MKTPNYKNAKGEEIDLYVKVFTRPNFRDGTHEMMLYSGKAFLDNIFDKKVIDPNTTYVWCYYPDTWANIPELQSLMDLIPYFYPNVTKVDITTHSVYIIQNVRSEHIRIHDDPTDWPAGHSDPMTHFSPPPDRFTGLHVLGGSIKQGEGVVIRDELKKPFKIKTKKVV